MFDFTGMAPLPEDDAEHKFLVLLDELDNFRHNTEILDHLRIEVDSPLPGRRRIEPRPAQRPRALRSQRARKRKKPPWRL